MIEDEKEIKRVRAEARYAINAARGDPFGEETTAIADNAANQAEMQMRQTIALEEIARYFRFKGV